MKKTINHRKTLAIAALAVSAIALTSCSSDGPGSRKAFDVELPDGGTVVCVGSSMDSSSGISCDWEGTRSGGDFG